MLTCVQIYNDWQTEWASADSRRLLPITSIPLWGACPNQRWSIRLRRISASEDLVAECTEALQGHRSFGGRRGKAELGGNL
jgi:hypothetical protein